MSVSPRRGRSGHRPIAPRLWLENLEAREVPAIGVLDTTFDTDGKVVRDVGFEPADVAVDSTGRVVVVGTTTSANGTDNTTDFVVTRFLADGSLDTDFGNNGSRKINFTANSNSQPDTARAVVIGPGDAILVAGASGDFAGEKFAVAKLDSSGTLDVGFGDAGGRVAFNINGGVDDVATDLAINPANGNLIVVGTSLESANVTTRFAGAQLTPDGTVTGSVRLNAISGGNGNEDFATAVTIDAQGRVIVVGSSRNATNEIRPSVVRLTSDGEEDNTFGTNGSLRIDTQAAGFASAEAVDTDAAGNIYVAFQTDVNTVGKLAIAKLAAADGDLDTDYGDGGVFLSPLLGGGGQPGAVGVEVQPGGQVIAAGTGETTNTTSGSNILVLQTTAGGQLDPAFNPTGANPGTLLIDSGTNNNDAARGSALTPNGQLVVVGVGVSGPDAGKAEIARVVISEAAAGTNRLSVGGVGGGTARVFAPTAGGQFTNISTTPANVFPGFGGEVRVATGDFNGDGTPDTVMVTGPGTKTAMAIVSGKDNSVLLQATDPFGDANFVFGGFVTAGDIDRDGRAEWVVTPELRGGPRVIIFRLLPDGSFDITSAGQPSLVANFFGIGDPNFRDGDRAALGDVNGDGVLDVFSIAAFNGGPRTALYSGADVLTHRAAGRDPVKLTGDFFAATNGQDDGRGGRSIAAGDVDGDGRADLIVTGDNLLGTGNQVTIYSGASLAAGQFPGGGATVLANFTVSGQSPTALVSVATLSADADNRADLAVGSGAGQASAVKVYPGSGLSGTTEPGSIPIDPFGAVTLNGVFVG